jgi:hypothetical protein
MIDLVKGKILPTSTDSESIRIRARVLDELEGEVRLGLKPKFVWNHVRVTFRSVSAGEDEVWKPLLGDFEALFRKRLRRIECELPGGFSLTTAVSRELDAPYCIEKEWLEAPKNEEAGTLRYGEDKIKLIGQTVALGRTPAPGGIRLDDRSVSREHGRAVCHDASYYYVQCSTTSSTRLLRDGRYRDVLPRAGLRLKHGDRLYCGRGSTPIVFEMPERKREEA